MKDRRQTEPLSGLRPETRRHVIRSADEAAVLRRKVLDNVERTAGWLRSCNDSPLDLFSALRFEKVGHDPISISGEAINIIEQINQTFTILVSLRAVEQLIEMHPEVKGFRLALGTCSGRDIESIELDVVAAEAFAATHPGSNQKLKKDLDRLKPDPARYRYVFFASPKCKPGRQPNLEPERGIILEPDRRIIEVHCVELFPLPRP